MALSQKVLDEMTAGANALAAHNNRAKVTPEDFARLMLLQERNQLLRYWERQRLLHTVMVSHPTQTGRRLETERWTEYHCKDGPVFDDKEAEKLGCSPSELLIANLALYFASRGWT
jgi:hypothetical protein